MSYFSRLILNRLSLAFFYREIGKKLILVVLLCLVIGLLDGIGLTMFLPLLQIADGSSQINLKEFGSLGRLFLLIENSGISLNINITLIFICVFFFLKGLIVYIGNAFRVSVQQYFVKKIRVRMLNALSIINFKTFVNSDIGKIQNTMSGEVARLSMSLTNYLHATQHLILVCVYVGFALMLNPEFAFFVIIGGGIFHLLTRRIYMFTKKASKSLTNESHIYQGLIIQFVTHFKYLRATGSVIKIQKQLNKQILKIEKNNRQLGLLTSVMTAIREPSMIIIVCISIIVQINLMGASLSAILVSLLFFYRALSSLLAVQTAWNGFLMVSGSMENMQEFQKELNLQGETFGEQAVEGLKNGLELKNVSLDFGTNRVLKNISLYIEKNKTIAFVGPSGGGKTTLINLLAGLFPPTEGIFLIDNTNSVKLDIRTHSKRIGYITQEPVIFNASIYDNITMWSKDDKESRDRFKLAVARASLYEFIEGLKEKELTILGNNGINLSGGQKQRISIARELYKDIDILIMDEATSALDSETERIIQKNIDSLHGAFTILIIAHRLSTVKNADKLVFIEDGEIKDSGTYDALLSNSLSFRRMVEYQHLIS